MNTKGGVWGGGEEALNTFLEAESEWPLPRWAKMNHLKDRRDEMTPWIPSNSVWGLGGMGWSQGCRLRAESDRFRVWEVTHGVI